MVDETRVHRLLRALHDEIEFLDREAIAPADRRADPAVRRGVKYAFITGVEACIDVAQHFCSARGWGPPNDNGHSMIVLGQHDVLPPALADRMRQAVGFRNVLVHEYVEVDEDIVDRRLADHGDLKDFVAAVLAYLDQR